MALSSEASEAERGKGEAGPFASCHETGETTRDAGTT